MSTDTEHKVGFFTDLHLGVHQNSEKWHDVTYKWAQWYTAELKSKNIKKIIFGGGREGCWSIFVTIPRSVSH